MSIWSASKSGKAGIISGGGESSASLATVQGGDKVGTADRIGAFLPLAGLLRAIDGCLKLGGKDATYPEL
jgi:hypothetical protein